MKRFFNLAVFLTLFMLAAGCGQAVPVTVTASPTLPPSVTQTSTFSAASSPATTATIEVTPEPTYVRPTLIPTIDSALLPELVKNVFSLQTFDMNGYETRHITGWDFGFGTTVAPYVDCPSHVWLDASHILLYPKAGQTTKPIEGAMRAVEAVPQAVVMNLERICLASASGYLIGTNL